MSDADDLHTPTTAAPEPEPTPVVAEADATAAHPVGTAAPPYAAPDDDALQPAVQKPEVQAAAAFAGGLVAALILKRLGR